MLKLIDIVARVKAKMDDPDSTYVTNDYVMLFVPDVYDWLFMKLELTGSSFAEDSIILPNVNAGTPDLSQFQTPGQPLSSLVQATMIRWRLPGQDATYFRRADGPLEFPRDIPNGIPSLDSWAWQHYIVKLSKFSTNLDLEVTGQYLFDSATSVDDNVRITMGANRVLSTKLASEIAKARNMPETQTLYSADADEALDDLSIVMTRAQQAVVDRVGRISRSTGNAARVSFNH